MTAAGPVTLHVWRVRPRDVPQAVVFARRAATTVRRGGGFAKVLGTSSAAFVPTAATVTRWALLTCGADVAATDTRWLSRAPEAARLSLRLLSSRGSWDRRAPFGAVGDEAYDDSRWNGPVVALTRATLRASRAYRFYRSVPAVARSLQVAPGCRLAFGVGEAPLLRQGTVSLWDSRAAMREFAYTTAPHVQVIRATPAQRWYAEELFAHFALVDATGTVDGRSVA